MSLELFVLSDRRLGSIAEWQQAIDAEGFPLRLSSETPLEVLYGILPVQIGDRQADFECAPWSASELIAENPDKYFGHAWMEALSFRWGGNLYSIPAAYMSAAAYAKATSGIVLDCEEGKIITPQRAGEIGNDVLRDLPRIEAELPAADARIKASYPDPSDTGSE